MALTVSELITAAISGGLGAKIAEWIHDEWRRRLGERRSARQVVEVHLDPILKGADELIGKIRSLARDDFRDLREIQDRDCLEFLATLHLFAQFWARIQVLRSRSVFVVLGSIEQGRRLQEFMRTLEATSVRLVSRAHQRAIGEILVEDQTSDPVTPLSRFYSLYAQEERLRDWLEPLASVLLETRQKKNRQRILVYGAVVHAMADTLDPEHRVTRRRSGWGNKINNRSRRELEYRVFRVYLPFVDRPHDYSRAPKN